MKVGDDFSVIGVAPMTQHIERRDKVDHEKEYRALELQDLENFLFFLYVDP